MAPGQVMIPPADVPPDPPPPVDPIPPAEPTPPGSAPPPVELAQAVAEAESETEPPGGPFPTWNSLYAAVLITLLGVIALLFFLTELLDHSAP